MVGREERYWQTADPATVSRCQTLRVTLLECPIVPEDVVRSLLHDARPRVPGLLPKLHSSSVAFVVSRFANTRDDRSYRHRGIVSGGQSGEQWENPKISDLIIENSFFPFSRSEVVLKVVWQWDSKIVGAGSELDALTASFFYFTLLYVASDNEFLIETVNIQKYCNFWDMKYYHVCMKCVEKWN